MIIHTTGPWSVEKREVFGDHHYTIKAGDFFVLRSYGDSLSDKDDATFASASPEMYELLKRAREELRLIHMKDTGAIYDVGLRVEMDIIIAKVEDRL